MPPADIRSIIERLPRPLAQAAGDVVRQTAGPVGGEDAMFKFVQLILRYGSLVDLARYASCAHAGRSDAQLERQLSGWSKPSFGVWLEYLRSLQSAVTRFGLPTSLPALSTSVGDEKMVDFARRVSGKNSTRVTFDQFFSLVVQWRNASAHADGVRRARPETEALRAALNELMSYCEASWEWTPVWVESSEVLKGRRILVKFWPAVGQSEGFSEMCELAGGAGIARRTLYLWKTPGEDAVELSPFFQWDEDSSDMLMLDSIDDGSPTFKSPRNERWRHEDPASELKVAASFLFERSGAPAMSGGDPLRDFRASVEDAADDGELSPADRNMLEKRRVRTGVSEADAAAILAEYAATSDTPTADAIGPPADSLVTTAPASPPTAAASRWSHLLSLPLDHGRLAPLFYAGAPRS